MVNARRRDDEDNSDNNDDNSSKNDDCKKDDWRRDDCKRFAKPCGSQCIKRSVHRSCPRDEIKQIHSVNKLINQVNRIKVIREAPVTENITTYKTVIVKHPHQCVKRRVDLGTICCESKCPLDDDPYSNKCWDNSKDNGRDGRDNGPQ